MISVVALVATVTVGSVAIVYQHNDAEAARLQARNAESEKSAVTKQLDELKGINDSAVARATQEAAESRKLLETLGAERTKRHEAEEAESAAQDELTKAKSKIKELTDQLELTTSRSRPSALSEAPPARPINQLATRRSPRTHTSAPELPNDIQGSSHLQIIGELTAAEQRYVQHLVEPHVPTAGNAVLVVQVLSISTQRETYLGQTGARIIIKGLCTLKDSVQGNSPTAKPVTAKSEIAFTTPTGDQPVEERLRTDALDKFVQSVIESIPNHP